MNPLFSIVIANYNYGRFLEEAVQSVLSQSFQDFELIIVDGGSTDNSIEIIKKYANRIAWWVSEKDKGQSDAFNKGFAHANGRFFAWLNADDILMPGALEAIKREIQRHPKCKWFVGSSIWCDEHLFVQRVFRAHKFSWMRLRSRDLTCCGPSSFFARELFECSGGFDVDLHFIMDNDLWYKFALLQGVEYRRTKAFVWVYRFHSDSKMAGRVVDPTSEGNVKRQRRIECEARILAERYGRPNLLWRITKRIPVSILDAVAAKILQHRYEGRHLNMITRSTVNTPRILIPKGILEYIKGMRRMPAEVFAFNNWSRKKFDNWEGVTFLDEAYWNDAKACAGFVDGNGIGVLYAQGFRSLLYLYRVKRLCRKHRPLIFTNCHSPALWDSPLKSFLLVFCACLFADGFVYLVERTQKKWKWLTSLFRLRTYHVRNPVEIERFPITKGECSKSVTLGCIGSIGPRKQQGKLVDMVAELRKRGYDVRARIAGDVASETYLQSIRDRVRELGIEDYVELDPIVPYDQVPEWMLKNDIYVCPSDAEVMPFSILEAMATGLPVVAHDVAGIGEEVRDGVNGHLIGTADLQNYVDAIVDIVSNGKWETMGSESRRLCETEFSLDEYAKRMTMAFGG